ncbi:hypothetical protein PAMA_004464 [Pampus argenteus]
MFGEAILKQRQYSADAASYGCKYPGFAAAVHARCRNVMSLINIWLYVSVTLRKTLDVLCTGTKPPVLEKKQMMGVVPGYAKELIDIHAECQPAILDLSYCGSDVSGW